MTSGMSLEISYPLAKDETPFGILKGVGYWYSFAQTYAKSEGCGAHSWGYTYGVGLKFGGETKT